MKNRSNWPTQIVDETPAGRAVQYGAAAREDALAKIDDGVGQRPAAVFFSQLADLDVVASLDRQGVLAGDGAEHLERCGDDLGADAFAAHQSDQRRLLRARSLQAIVQRTS